MRAPLPLCLARPLWPCANAHPRLPLSLLALAVVSEMTADGRRAVKLDQILLNGNNIAMLVPGGEGPVAQ